MMNIDNDNICLRVIEAVRSSCRPYAVFVGRSIEFMPVDGKRFASLSSSPERMAHLVGIFDVNNTPADVVAAVSEMSV